MRGNPASHAAAEFGIQAQVLAEHALGNWGPAWRRLFRTIRVPPLELEPGPRRSGAGLGGRGCRMARGRRWSRWRFSCRRRRRARLHRSGFPFGLRRSTGIRGSFGLLFKAALDVIAYRVSDAFCPCRSHKGTGQGKQSQQNQGLLQGSEEYTQGWDSTQRLIDNSRGAWAKARA